MPNSWRCIEFFSLIYGISIMVKPKIIMIFDNAFFSLEFLAKIDKNK